MELSEMGRVMETDVLVLGAGAAGCGAALAARNKGAKCIIVDKGSLEACGQVGPGNANWHTHLGTAEWDTAEEYTKFWAGEPTSNLSASLFHKGISLRMPEMLKRILAIGIKFHKNPDGSYRVTAGLGQPYPWTTTMINSKYFKRLVAKEVRRVGAEVADHVMITGLLTEKGTVRIAGATGLNISTGEFIMFRAKAVVICMSTSNERFSNSSTSNPFNTWLYPFNTGSGPLIAYDAGAKVTTLEKASATVLSMGFGAPGMAAFTGMGAYMINASGERYMFKYDKRGENAPRHIFLMSAYTEVAEGRGPLYIDARHLNEKNIEHMVEERLYVDGDTYPEYFKQKRLSLKNGLLEIEVGEMNGGGCLLVNDRFESVNVKGLYGYSPSVLSHAMCGGYSSAYEAAEDALKTTGLPEVDAEDVARERERVYAPLKSKGDNSWREYEDTIRQVMNYYMGHVRNKQGMELALKKLKKIEKQTGEMKASNTHELLRVNEAMHLVRYCQLMVRSALERKESGRGCYRRTDYPELDPSLNSKEIVQWQENGKPKIAAVTMR